MAGDRINSARADFVWQSVFGLALVAWTFLLGCTPMRDFDIWWHVRAGQLILERGEVPQTDWFTYTERERAWIDLHWGFQIASALLHRWGGFDAILLAKAAVAAVAVGVGWWGCGVFLPAPQKALIWVVGITALSGRIFSRPDIVSLLAVACWLAILLRSRQSPRLLWCLPVVQVLWVNFHALSILGIALGTWFLIDCAVGRVAAGRWGYEQPPVRLPWQSNLVIIALVAAANFASPYGVRGALFPIELFRKLSVDHAYYSRRIAEFVSPYTYLEQHGVDTVFFPAALLLGLILIASFIACCGQSQFSAFRLLTALAFTYLFCDAVRNLNLWALVATMIACANFGDFYRAAQQTWLKHGHREWMRWQQSLANGSALLLVAILIGLVATGWWGRNLAAAWGNQFRLGFFDKGYFPLEAVHAAGHPALPRRAYLAPFGLASIYIFEHGPDAKVFIDPRLEVASLQTYENWETIGRMMGAGDENWQSLVSDSDGTLPVVVLDPKFAPSAVDGMLGLTSWQIVYADDWAVVFATKVAARSAKLPEVDARRLWWHPQQRRAYWPATF